MVLELCDRLHGMVTTIGAAFIWFFVPETKGLTLEQVDRMLEETTPRTSKKLVPHSLFEDRAGVSSRDTAEKMNSREPIAHREHRDI